MDLVPPAALTPEQIDLRSEIRDFVAEEIEPLDLDDLEWRDDPADRIPWSVFDAAFDRGLRNLTVPTEYDGRDASPLTLTMAAEEVSAGDMGVAVTLNQMWKIPRIVDRMADPDLRERFFEAFADDPRHLLGICLSEPAHGTDTQIDQHGMRFDTTATRDGDAWVLDGEKRYISCAPEAKTLVVYAQSDPEASAHDGTTAFVVPTDADGLSISHVWEKVAARTQNNGTVRLEGVRVPDEDVLGPVHGAKPRTAEVLREGHVESGAVALGTARRAFDAALEHASERVQGGTEIINHQAIGHEFADMLTRLHAARSLLWSAARSIEDLGADYEPAVGQMAKLFAAETAAAVGQRALETFGGAGIMFETDPPIQKYFRESIVYLHSDGTRNAHREVIAEALRGRFD